MREGTIPKSPSAIPGKRPETVARQAKLQLQVCISLMYTTFLFSSLALPGGAKQIPMAWVTGILHFLVLALLTRGAFNSWRLIAIGSAFFLILLETAIFHSDFSPTSLLYIGGIYAPLALTVPLLNAGALRQIWKHVSILAIVIATCGLLQIAVQLLFRGLFLDPIRQLPAPIVLEGYSISYPVSSAFELMKPNGMFLPEPSFFSQLMALGLLSEAVFFQRKWHMVLFVAALAASFSGTGILMLLIALPFVGSPRVILSLAVLAAAAIVVVSALGLGDFFMNRATETREAGTSGDMRFVAPYEQTANVWGQTTSSFLFGKGAGSSERMSGEDANFGPIPKVAVEYGAIGSLAFANLWFSMFWPLALQRALVVAMLIFYFVASGGLLQPFTVFAIWALTGGFLKAPGSKTLL